MTEILATQRVMIKVIPRTDIYKQTLPELERSIDNTCVEVQNLFNICYQANKKPSKKTLTRLEYLSDLLAKLKEIKNELTKL